MAAGIESSRANRARSVAGVFSALDTALQGGQAVELVPIPTGFHPLDTVLRGGFHPGELILVGGAPGAGKTIVTLQWARNIAIGGRTVMYVSYEHEDVDLVLRLLALEMGEVATSPDDGKLQGALMRAAGSGHTGLVQVLQAYPVAMEAYERIRLYADRLWLVRASGASMGLPELEGALRMGDEEPPAVLFVDYLQKIAVIPEPRDTNEKVTRSVEGLKDLALNYKMPVVAIVASDREGIRSGRLRLHHFRGSSALAFESDVVMVINEKIRAVSKVHLAYDSVRSETFKDWAVLSIEKNRGGENLANLEYRKDFSHFRFDPLGGVVSERMADEEAFVDRRG